MRWSACWRRSPRRRCTIGCRPKGRLDPDDEPAFGTNVVPLGMSREELRDGFIEVMRDLYEPEAYFARLESLYLEGRFRLGEARAKYWRRHPVDSSARAGEEPASLRRAVRPIDATSARGEIAGRISPPHGPAHASPLGSGSLVRVSH